MTPEFDDRDDEPTNEYIVTCETDDLDSDPRDRNWRCPNCELAVLEVQELIAPAYIGEAFVCPRCGYFELLR